VADTARLEEALRALMRARRSAGAGSSQCPTRALVMREPPDADAGEITDKGYINQGAVLSRRAAAVAALYAEPAAAGVITG
jgi:feruloyl-CoA synthase